MLKKQSFFITRLKSVHYAYRGAMLLLKTEASIQMQFVIAVLVIIAGFYFNISTTEWVLQCLAIGMVMSIEGVNTAIESLADFIHPEYHDKIGFIKDISAGAVFIAAMVAIVVGIIIYFPKVF